MRETLSSELNVLANRITRLAKRDRRTRDFSLLGIRNALTDIVARFPVYRTYVDASTIASQDRRDIEWAVATAQKASRTADTDAYDFIGSLLTAELPRSRGRSIRRREVVELAMRVQQYTAPVMAKSVEDTAFYRDARFLARNEVGGDPDRFYTSAKAFQIANRQRGARWPFTLLSTATHDHKRGEDVRARLNVISEIPLEWEEWTHRIFELTSGFVGTDDDREMPTRNDRYLLLQTLVGTWPFDFDPHDEDAVADYTERMTEYMTKAVREAKLETSWTAPDGAYERALGEFISSVLNPQRSQVILPTIQTIVDRIIDRGAVNSLAQKALVLTVPGVPDVYQGSELWDLSLVDPDNRRPVDFGRRREMLDSIEHSPDGCARALENWRDAMPKLHLIAAILSVRERWPDLFAAGDYSALEVTGRCADNVVAFSRGYDESRIVAVVPRLPDALAFRSDRPLLTRWDDTSIEMPRGARWKNAIDGRLISADRGAVPLDELLEHFPVAVLVSTGADE
jgi:(1->4)-alpha-D-glucan 1-alpha-D-glucosylmutase